ncbi:hypothetical protein ASALC70_00589 [Alcanivorax sp. ALC70]|nr:hypothetical protein ASALC70_00589 [Alcanivorax sp. ALC70]
MKHWRFPGRFWAEDSPSPWQWPGVEKSAKHRFFLQFCPFFALKRPPWARFSAFGAALFRLEHHRSSDEVAGLLHLLVKWLSGPDQAELRRSCLEWLRRRLPRWFPGETFPEMHDLQETYEMITNRFEEWKERQRLAGVEQGLEQGVEQGRAQGVEQGRLEGERALVLRQIQHRFGDLPAVYRLRLQSASQAELESLADRVLDATSLDELFR